MMSVNSYRAGGIYLLVIIVTLMTVALCEMGPFVDYGMYCVYGLN